MRQLAATHGLYLEWGGASHIPRRMDTWERADLLARNRRAAAEAQALGARVVRSCSGGLMRWDPSASSTDALLRETAAAVTSQATMLRDHGVVLAIELHLEFTTHKLLRLFEQCDAAPGDYLGVVLDTMNLRTLLEDPLRATRRILPWVVATHVKDGGLRLTRDGLESFPTGIGESAIDLPRILVRLAGQAPGCRTLSVEDHGGTFSLLISDRRFLRESPDLTAEELVDLVALARRTEAALDAGRCRAPDVLHLLSGARSSPTRASRRCTRCTASSGTASGCGRSFRTSRRWPRWSWHTTRNTCARRRTTRTTLTWRARSSSS
jgi:sugar phosphate isomerase/epimerase